MSHLPLNDSSPQGETYSDGLTNWRELPPTLLTVNTLTPPRRQLQAMIYRYNMATAFRTFYFQINTISCAALNSGSLLLKS